MLQVTALAQLFLVLCTVLINSIWIVKGGKNFDWKPDINGTNDYTCDLDFCTGDQFDVNRCCACLYIESNISEFSPLHVEIINNKGESVVILNKKDIGAVNVSIKHSNGWLRFFPSNLCDFKSELKSIDFSYNQIKQWTNFSCLYMLDSLNLTRNSLATVSNSTFIGLYSLRSVDLSFNEIRTIDLHMLSDQSIHLFNLDLSNNLMKTLDASNMIVQDKFFCKIDFSYNEIRGLTNTDETLLTNEVNQNGGDIFLRNMREEFYFNELFSYSFKTIEDYQILFSNFRGTYDIKNSKAHCDCHVARFLKFCPDDFYRIYKAKNNKLVCGSPENLVNVSVIDLPLYNEVFDEMICEVWDHCPRKCKCIEQPRRDRLFIDCSNQSLHTLPAEMPQSLFNLEIDFSDNSIINIDNREYLKRTVEINFERNLLKTVDKTFIENIPMMSSVNLKENQITTLAKEIQNLHPDIFLFNQTEVVCECSSEWIKIWRELKHANKSFEFGCRAENGHGVVIELFSFIDLFCETEKPDNSAIIIGFLVLLSILSFVLTALFFFHFELSILGAKLRRKTHKDWNRDVFISFDEENIEVFIFIQKILKPNLIRKGYKVFASDDMLFGQSRDLKDEHNVQVEPRDVIIVLSDNFDKPKNINDNCWIMTEFDYCWKKFIGLHIRNLITLNFDSLSSSDLSNRKLKAVKRICPCVLVPDRRHEVLARFETILGAPIRKHAFN